MRSKSQFKIIVSKKAHKKIKSDKLNNIKYLFKNINLFLFFNKIKQYFSHNDI